MRLRNVPGSRDMIAESPYTIKNETEQKGKWHEVFDNSNPIHIEIGMGKGQFLMTLAGQNPDINYVGIEKYCTEDVKMNIENINKDIITIIEKHENDYETLCKKVSEVLFRHP